MGFRREGVHTRDLLIHGQFVDCLAMGLEDLTRPSWRRPLCVYRDTLDRVETPRTGS